VLQIKKSAAAGLIAVRPWMEFLESPFVDFGLRRTTIW
jgi:hypothetical protein